MKPSAAVRSKVLARNAANDGAIGAAVGLLVVAGTVAVNLDVRDAMLQSGQPLSSLASYILVVVAQAAAVVGLLGAGLRKFASYD